MSKEFTEDTISRAPSLRERLTRVIEDVMAGDSYVIFPEGGIMPVREHRISPQTPEITIIDNTV